MTQGIVNTPQEAGAKPTQNEMRKDVPTESKGTIADNRETPSEWTGMGSTKILFVVAVAVALLAGAMGNTAADSQLFPEIARCGTAVFTKLAGSMDDVVWLMPFMCGALHTKAKHGACYLTLFAVEVCVCTAVTAFFACLVELMLPARFAAAGWDVPCVMQLAGGSLLGFFGIKLFWEWRAGEDDEDDAEDGETGSLGIKELVVIGILGSLDDMCLQASTLASGTFAFRHMMVGALVGCSVVVAICWGASQLQFVLKLATSVPLWCVIGGLSVYTYIGAFMG